MLSSNKLYKPQSRELVASVWVMLHSAHASQSSYEQPTGRWKPRLLCGSHKECL